VSMQNLRDCMKQCCIRDSKAIVCACAATQLIENNKRACCCCLENVTGLLEFNHKCACTLVDVVARSHPNTTTTHDGTHNVEYTTKHTVDKDVELVNYNPTR
jgi:hypothetical protein